MKSQFFAFITVHIYSYAFSVCKGTAVMFFEMLPCIFVTLKLTDLRSRIKMMTGACQLAQHKWARREQETGGSLVLSLAVDAQIRIVWYH